MLSEDSFLLGILLLHFAKGITDGFLFLNLNNFFLCHKNWSSPYINHFLQPDTLIPDPSNPQAWNRYSYVTNSPINFNDPTGHMLSNDDQNEGGKCDLRCLNNLHKKEKGGKGSGCNTETLKNANGDYCHHTTYTPKQICFDVFECDPREHADYASRFQYPGQMPWNPIDPLAERTDGYVMGGDFMSDNYLAQRFWREKGAVYVETDGSTMTNYTKITHIFYQGQINRTVSGNHVTTEGYGTNTTWLVAAANQYGGPIAFEANDLVMLAFSTADQLSHGMVVELMDAIP